MGEVRSDGRILLGRGLAKSLDPVFYVKLEVDVLDMEFNSVC